MAAPNSYNFTVTRDTVITDALLYVGAIAEGDSPSSAALTEAARVLNMIIKLRAADIPAISIRRGIILPFTEASSINTNSHVVTSYGSTAIGADEASGQTQLTVDSTTGMAASDQIGIEMDDGTMHWTTISSVDDSTTVTVATAIDDEAADGNRVFFYTASDDRVVRPIRIMDANILQLTDNSSWELNIDSRDDYFHLGDRTTTGTPNRIFYDAVLGSRTADPATATEWYGTIYVYPRFNSGDAIIEFTYQEPIQDVDSSSDNLYIPQEFYLPVMLELASLLGGKYGLELEERSYMKKEAAIYREEALTVVRESADSMFIQPEEEWR